MPFWKSLFGSKAPDTPAAGAADEEHDEDYKGFRISPAPIREGGQFRVAARIEKDGRQHRLIRADTTGSQEEARAAAIRKARQLIDERGEGLFG